MKLLLTHPLPPSERRCLSVDQVDGGGESTTDDTRGAGRCPVIGLSSVDWCLPLCLWLPVDAISPEKKKVKFSV